MPRRPTRGLPCAIVAVLLGGPSRAWAQGCCGGAPREAPGVPSTRAKLQRGAISTGMMWNHASAGRLENDGMTQQSPVDDTATVDSFDWTLAAGLTQWLGATLTLPIVWSRFDTLLPSGDRESLATSGVGDLTIIGRAELPIARPSLAISLGLRVPTGASRAHDDDSGILIPLSLQPGAGHWQIMPGAHGSLLLAPLGRDWVPRVFIDATGRIPVGSEDGYQTGGAVGGDVGAGAHWRARFHMALAFLYTHTTPDHHDGDVVPDTGSDTLAAALGLGWAFLPWLEMTGFVERNVWRDTRGPQLVGDWRFGAGIWLTRRLL